MNVKITFFYFFFIDVTFASGCAMHYTHIEIADWHFAHFSGSSGLILVVVFIFDLGQWCTNLFPFNLL